MPNRETFRNDLKRANIPFKDSMDRKVDLHALRYTFGTWLARSGATPRVAMELMRHTDIRLTTNLYTDPKLLNVTGAVEDLPSLGTEPQKESLKATGTDDAACQRPEKEHIEDALPTALNRVSDRPGRPISGQVGTHRRSKTPTKSRYIGGGGGNRTHVRMPET
jgi:hypothetical protein